MSLHRVKCTCCTPAECILEGNWCGTAPSCLGISTPSPVYFHCSTLQAGTEDPIEDGQTVVYRGLCYTLTDDFAPPDPLKVEDVEELEITTCGSATCTADWYYLAVACEHNGGNILVEYCTAREIAASATGQCPVFEIGGVCYRLDLATQFVGAIASPSGTVITSLGSAIMFDNCCHCNDIITIECSASYGAFSTSAPACWNGDPRGGCCGRVYRITITWEKHVELFNGGTKYLDDVMWVEQASFVVGGPQDCASGGAGSGRAMTLDIGAGAVFKRRWENTSGPPIVNEYEHDLDAQFVSGTNVTVNPALGCGGGPAWVKYSGTCFLRGSILGHAASWFVHHTGPSFLGRVVAVNGQTFDTACSFSGREYSGANTWVEGNWDIRANIGQGNLSYSYELVTEGLLDERGSITASYRIEIIEPCAKCDEQGPSGFDSGEDSADGGGGMAMGSMGDVDGAVAEAMRMRFGRPCHGCGG